MKSIIITLCIIHLSSFTLLAQKEYYELFTEIISVDDKPPPTDLNYTYWRRFRDKVFFHDGYTLNFWKSGVQEIGKDLNFWHVSVIDTHSEKVYVKLNRKNNPPFEFRESTQYSEFVNGLKATGVTKIINGYQCEEYLGDAFPSAEVRYYITRELPYIKYQATNVNLPGFVVEKEIYWGDKTKIKLQHSLKKIEYNPTYFKYLEEFKKYHNRDPKFILENYTNDSKFDESLIKKINQKVHHLKSYNNEIKDFQKSYKQEEKIDFTYKFGHQKTMKYYNSKGQITHELINKSKEWELTTYHYDKTNRLKSTTKDGRLNRLVEKNTLKEKFPEGFYSSVRKYDDNEKSIEVINERYNHKTLFNKDNRVLSEYTISPETTWNIKYHYKNERIDFYTREKIINADKSKHVYGYSFDYHNSGLIKTIIEIDGDTTNYNYICRIKAETDSIYIISEKQNYEKVQTLILDKYGNTDRLGTIIYSDVQPLDEDEVAAQKELRTYYLENFIVTDSIASEFKVKSYLDSIKIYKRYPFLYYKFLNNKRKAPYEDLRIIPAIQLGSLEIHQDSANETIYKVHYIEKIIGRFFKSADFYGFIKFEEQNTDGEIITHKDLLKWELHWRNESHFVLMKKSKSDSSWSVVTKDD